ncbi:MAG: cell division protein FtsA [Bacteroidales bacterium]|nr:cell division protein FtsA [Bacteroidales bacterium]
MEERYLVTVDFGSHKLALAVAKVGGGYNQVLYFKEFPSVGVRHGIVWNPLKASDLLKKAIADAENELGIKITQVVVGYPRIGLRQEIATGNNERTDDSTCISQEEVDFVKSKALNSYPLNEENNEVIYSAVPQSFATEDAMGLREEDVVGMTGSFIDGNFKVFVGNKKRLDNIDNTLNKAEVGLARRYFLPEAVADVVLTSEEKENGVALLELGGNVSSVTIYEGGILRYYFAIPYGGGNVTFDIKRECGFNDTLAENIKQGYGVCMPDKLQSLTDKILRISNDNGASYQDVPVKYLSEIITCRMKEIIDALLFKIQESNYADRLTSGVVLTGGCANLGNCSGLVKSMSGYNVRVGYPRLKEIAPNDFASILDPGSAATVGMLYKAFHDVINCTKEYFPQTAGPAQETVEAQPARPSTTGPIEDELHTVKGETEESSEPQGTQSGQPVAAEPDALIGSVFDPEAGKVEKPVEKPEKQTWLGKFTTRWTKTFADATGQLFGEMN